MADKMKCFCYDNPENMVRRKQKGETKREGGRKLRRKKRTKRRKHKSRKSKTKHKSRKQQNKNANLENEKKEDKFFYNNYI